MLDKPPFASPCNHCGVCCTLSLCPAGELAFPGQSAPCPALVSQGEQKLCGLVLAEALLPQPPLLRQTLGIGCGCSMPDPTTTDFEIEEFDRISFAKVQTETFPPRMGPADPPAFPPRQPK